MDHLGWLMAGLLIAIDQIGRIAEQIPPLAKKVIAAIKAIRQVKAAWKK
ncbi:hypothetical protein ACFVU0_31405 [Streptomyces sp. NPDC058122]